MAVSTFAGVIPPDYSNQILQEAVQQSAALRMGTRVPMGTSVVKMPVPKTFPSAGWVSVGGRKPFTDLSLDLEEMTAEEVAAVIAIPDVYVEDYSINLWNYARPLVAEAIAAAVDDAILFGVDAPATFPVGGVAAAARNIPAGSDVVDTINNALSGIESGGLTPTGFAADIAVRGSLRGARDSAGDFLMGFDIQDRMQIPTLYGLPIAYGQFTQEDPDFFAGAWRYLLIGVRQDVRYSMDPSAVIADSDGRVIVTGFQDNTTPLKVWARLACAIIKPVTRRCPQGANPFAKAQLAPDAVRCANGQTPDPGGTNGGEPASAGLRTTPARPAAGRQPAGRR